MSVAMSERLLLRFCLLWCLILTLWGGYFTYKFVEHIELRQEQSEQTLKLLKEVKALLER